jgi:DNA-binding ferritin-like protein
MSIFFRNLNKKLEEKIDKDPLYGKTKQGNYINIAGTGQGGTILLEALTDKVFEKGRSLGKKEGYVQASFEYEKKLIKQAEEFLKQAKVFESDKARYEQLIDDYERYIDEMMQKSNMSNEEKDYMTQIMVIERKLKKMK